MSETRVEWKPWRAKTRTAASRMLRRLSIGGAFGHQALISAELRPDVGVGPAVGERGQRARAARPARPRSRSAATKPSPSGDLGEHRPPGVDDRRVAVGVEVGRRLADLVGGDDEGLVLDRAGAQQDLPVVAAGRRGEGRGDGDQAGAAHGEDPEELGEAQVVTDGQPDAQLTGARGDDLGPGLLVLGLAIGDPADVDVEHVDLAVDGEVRAVGADQHRGVEGPLAGALGDAAGEQVDAELARPSRGRRRGSGRRAARRRPAAPRRRPAGSTSPAGRRNRRRRPPRRARGARPRRGCAPSRRWS